MTLEELYPSVDRLQVDCSGQDAQLRWQSSHPYNQRNKVFPPQQKETPSFVCPFLDDKPLKFFSSRTTMNCQLLGGTRCHAPKAEHSIFCRLHSHAIEHDRLPLDFTGNHCRWGLLQEYGGAHAQDPLACCFAGCRSNANLCQAHWEYWVAKHMSTHNILGQAPDKTQTLLNAAPMLQ
jgi:hypothetical protein